MDRHDVAGDATNQKHSFQCANPGTGGAGREWGERKEGCFKVGVCPGFVSLRFWSQSGEGHTPSPYFLLGAPPLKAPALPPARAARPCVKVQCRRPDSRKHRPTKTCHQRVKWNVTLRAYRVTEWMGHIHWRGRKERHSLFYLPAAVYQKNSTVNCTPYYTSMAPFSCCSFYNSKLTGFCYGCLLQPNVCYKCLTQSTSKANYVLYLGCAVWLKVRVCAISLLKRKPRNIGFST